MQRSGKDWRNHPKRSGHGSGVDNYGFDGPSSRAGQKFYNDNYGPGGYMGPGASSGSTHYSYSTGQQQQQQVAPCASPPPKGYPYPPGPPHSIGDPLEDEFNPIEKRRKCRDVVCLGILAAAIVFMVAGACYAFAKGDLRRIRDGALSFGDDKCDNLTISEYLVRHLRLQQPEGQQRLQNGYPHQLFVHYYDPRAARDVFDDAKSFYNEVTEDFERSWKEIVIMCFIALGVTIVMTALLRLFAGVIIWVVVIGVSLAAIAGTIFLWIYWSARKKDRDNGVEGAWSQNRVNGLLAGAVVASIVTVLILLVFLFMRKRIKLVIRLFNEAGKAVHAMPLVLLQPLLTFVALAIALGLWFLILLFIETAGEPEFTTDADGVAQCKMKKNWLITFSRWWNLFMMYWITQFIIGCQHLITAGAVSTWFFTRKKSRLGFPILTAFKRLLRFHLGTIAFGSLIIAIVKLIRAVLNWISNRLGDTNVICKALMCCCKCFVWCLEKFLIFLNRNAYIEVAIYGYGFCKSARKAFKVIVNNALRVSAINSIGDFVLFLGKVTIVAATVVIGNEILKAKGGFNYISAPLLVAGICAYLIAHCFISVYEMAIDTIFICFCEDCELNDGVTRPYFMSKGLMEFVKNSEKALKSKK